MPYLQIQTNRELATDRQRELLTEASRCVAEQLGKPESYVMVSMQDARPMLFAGSDAPLAYLELKSLGLPENKTAEFSKALCELMQAKLGIEPNRVYIEFAGPERHMWGWNEATF